MMTIRALTALVVLCLLPTLARADSFRPVPLKPGTATTVQAYGRQNPACAEWTNGCVVCTTASGHAQCSTPGIACTPAGLTCRRKATP